MVSQRPQALMKRRPVPLLICHLPLTVSRVNTAVSEVRPAQKSYCNEPYPIRMLFLRCASKLCAKPSKTLRQAQGCDTLVVNPSLEIDDRRRTVAR